MSDLFLFSVDIEDFFDRVPEGQSVPDRIAGNLDQYRAFLRKNDCRCTFFVVGRVAQKYPELIKSLLDDGHEIGCHSLDHKPLTELTIQDFRNDLDQFLTIAEKAGATDIKGYRAPFFSMTESTVWAYDILKDFGFIYSSSVLPAKNPRYGWADFDADRHQQTYQVKEIPVSLTPFPGWRLPYAGGVYFRALPFMLIKACFAIGRRQSAPIVSYFHPYDVDHDQERIDFPELKNNRLYQWLMYHNRDKVIPRLERLMSGGYEIRPFRTLFEV